MASETTTRDLRAALEHGTILLRDRPDLAEAQAREILVVFPGEINATVLLGRAQRGQGRLREAATTFEDAIQAAPDYAVAHYELGVTQAGMGRSADAVTSLQRATKAKPGFAPAWKTLAEVTAARGESDQSEAARRQHMQLTVKNPALLRAAGYLHEDKLAKAEAICRDEVQKNPTDVAAIRMLAEVGSRLGQHRDACVLLKRCLELAPEFHAARGDYANVLHKSQQYERALAELDKLHRVDPDNPSHELLRASVFVHTGEFEQAIARYENFLDRYPLRPRAKVSYGHALKTVGRQREAIDEYRSALQRQPTLGEAYWSLANLKTFRFEDSEIEAMAALIAGGLGDREDQFHLYFALGKALEDRGDHSGAFENYRMGNAVRRKEIRWDADEHHSNLARHAQLYDEQFFASRSGGGCPAQDPIFIVGLPRAGSTLLEQILASHSQVDGTMELPDIISISRRLNGRRRRGEPARYPGIVAGLSPEQLRALGEEYLERTRIQRGTAPYFIDKMPNNFAHIGLIQLILPNAKIIDARRHPLACCFGGFKQLFAHGQNFTYDLVEIGRYYRDYVELMDHWRRVLPERVLQVRYEEVVADTESQVRRLLDYCGLEFEDACLAFHETERAVRTASSEQVRQPIFTEGIEQWRQFEPHLGPVAEVLGTVLDQYPQR